MKLYTRTGASSVVHPDFGQFDVDEDGGVTVPDELGQQLHHTFLGGLQSWETDAERFARLAAEKAEKDADPRTLLAELKGLRDELTGKPKATPVKRAKKSAPAAKAE